MTTPNPYAAFIAAARNNGKLPDVDRLKAALEDVSKLHGGAINSEALAKIAFQVGARDKGSDAELIANIRKRLPYAGTAIQAKLGIGAPA